ncbi:hypothetical protein F2Q69_00019750 [Brassica cretica]|uniref:Uncharacterized protein n=1 Tax=Brassica cretica TaxID=69181 RepID=A0A8S9PWV0_BRACR|nr:hypothetical protein F2Q69_00019750 [Brassica cretica]
MRATSRGRCETSLRERLSSSGHRKCERLGPVALITSLQLERPRGVAAKPRYTARYIAGSVPFLWEEAPGKPRSSARKPQRTNQTRENRGVARCLDLPPPLLLPGEACKSSTANEPSPTTVLDGPYDFVAVHCRYRDRRL